jgi:hypothetical protein
MVAHQIKWKNAIFNYDNSLEMKLVRGNYVVLYSACNEFREILWNGVIFYMNDDFPMDEFQYLLDSGFIWGREASLTEKAMCYNLYDTSNYSACSLNGVQFYLDYERKSNF